MDRRKYAWVLFWMGLSLGAIIPVYQLVFRERSLDYLQIGLLSALFELPIVLLEVPTGVLADRWGRRRSVLLGLTALVAAGFAYWLGWGFWPFVLAGVVQAFGECCISGALEAWAVDSNPVGVQDLLARGTAARRTGLLLGMLLGGLIGQVEPALAWVLYAAGHVVALAAAFIAAEAAAERAAAQTPTGFRATFAAAIGVRFLVPLLATVAAMELARSVGDDFWQLLLHEQLGMPAAWLGATAALGSLLVAVLAVPATRWFRISAPRQALVYEGFVLVGLIGLAAATWQPYAAVAVVPWLLLEVGRGLQEPALHAWLNELIPSEKRATLLSAVSFSGSGGEVLAGIAGGTAAHSLGLGRALAGAAAAGVVVLVAFKLLVQKASAPQ
ncbi:MAG TPA: MFS transporter [Symbiobacteriaceae bacterium]|nr:MFS transporter [Symbiobacteriaceae bacterium]